MIRYILVFLLVTGCSGLKINTEIDPAEPGKILFYTERLVVKEQRPFDLSELAIRFLLIKSENQEKKLIGFYYNGNSYPYFQKFELQVENSSHEFEFSEPVTSEDLGMLGVAVVYYIELPDAVLKNILASQKLGFQITGTSENFGYLFTSKEKNNFIEFFARAGKEN